MIYSFSLILYANTINITTYTIPFFYPSRQNSCPVTFYFFHLIFLHTRRINFEITLEMFKFEVPSLTVGTLDTLMTLSDNLVKTDGVVEQTVRKIERTSADLFDRKSSELSVGGEFEMRSTGLIPYSVC